MVGLNDNFKDTEGPQLTSSYLDKQIDINGVRIQTTLKKTMSCDFHAVVQNGNSIYILVADSSGHGLSAGPRLTTLFNQLAIDNHSIITIASKLNDELYQYKHKDYFVALTLVRINEHDGFIDVLNCGNPAAILIGEDNQFLHTFKSTALACGIVENGDYEHLIEHINYTRAPRFYVFTDGIYDALIRSGQCQNSAEYECLYKSNCFDDICTYLETAQNKIKTEDATLVEVNMKSPKNVFPIPKTIDKLKAKSLCDHEVKKQMANSIVMCIDSDPSLLRSFNYDLAGFVSGLYLCQTVEETIEVYQQASPNLIIIDLTFLLKHQPDLSSIFPENDCSTPIIITCEPSNIILAEQLFTLPITRYLQKPHNTTELLTKVKDCIKSSVQREHWQYNSAVFQESSLAMTITSADKNIIQVNNAFCSITGYDREELINCSPRLLSSGRHDASFYERMWHNINTTGHWSGEIWNKRKTGELFLEWITINAIKNKYDEVISYCSVFSDITERKAVDEAIRKLSNYDDLTELPNRRLFKAKLENSIQELDDNHNTNSLAVLFLDLDKFKEINDTLGHDFGDLVLIETAVRLKQCLRDSDLIARLGGDEFTICLTPNDTDSIEIVTKKILAEISTKSFKIKGEKIHLSISIGVAQYPNHGTDVSSLLKHADQAMFYAKEEGRNCIRFFTQSMEASALEKRSLTHQLHLAVKHTQFELFYQPIIELHTNSIHKAEALIRWNHPEKGIISPDKFIPLAEETGLIMKIGDWVFEQAVLQSKQWRIKINPQFQISINKSPKQFGQDKQQHLDWLDYLSLNQLPASGIAVEITEGVMMDSKETVFSQLLSFRDKGIQISLDDFGTGHSSLAYLRKFDIDYLKIDREFVQNIETSPDDQALCKAIISMAHTLGIKVIAEGIETTWQRDFFVNSSCDYGQGYLFSKPVPAKQFEQYFTNVTESEQIED